MVKGKRLTLVFEVEPDVPLLTLEWCGTPKMGDIFIMDGERYAVWYIEDTPDGGHLARLEPADDHPEYVTRDIPPHA
jgi:hypothetical protein